MGYLNEEQELMLESVKALCEERLTPEVLADMEKDIFPNDVLDEMINLGLPTMTLPEQFGGLSQSMVAHVAIEKEIARKSLSLALIGTNCVVASMLSRLGTEQQKQKYLPDIVKRPAGFAFTEPGAGSDAAGISTTAVRDGDGWILNGQKTFISFVNQVDWFLVSAKTSNDPKNNISVFLVPKNAPGFKSGSLFHKLGMRASDTGELLFDNLKLPADALIGQEGKGLRAALSLLDEARLGVASCALGIAEESIDRARTFVKERVAFGKPLATKQGLQWYLAEMQTNFDAAQALVLQAAQAFDDGESIVTKAAEAKLFATKVAIEASDRAVQMCGGYGLIEDFGVERLYRDAKVCSIIEGTDEVLKMVVSRAVLA